MLNPDMPSPSVNKLDYYRSRFGKRVDSMIPQMQQVGDSLGIKFSYGGQLGNTLSSHRLVSWAAKQHGHEGEDRMITHIFRAYFEQERDISDHSELVKIATEAGFDNTTVSTFLSGDEGKEELLNEVHQWQRKVNGVPFFVIDDKHAFSGAQDEEFLVSVFQKVGVPLKTNAL
jgi:predicted DsbA family dithiol-disulfide isomerase